MARSALGQALMVQQPIPLTSQVGRTHVSIAPVACASRAAVTPLSPIRGGDNHVHRRWLPQVGVMAMCGFSLVRQRCWKRVCGQVHAVESICRGPANRQVHVHRCCSTADVVRGIPPQRPTKRVQSATVGFKQFLLVTERTQPLWYSISDLYLTSLGAFCVYLCSVEPEVALKYRLSSVEDIVNVNFFIRYLLLFWANDFRMSWLTGTEALLDLASCLPVLVIPARSVNLAVGKSMELLQIFRFLRLLRQSIPSAMSSKEEQVKERAPLQILSVVSALAGTIALSATLLYQYENALETPMRSFEDTVLYMVNVFAGRDPPFFAQTQEGKQVTVAATVAGTIFLPFLIAESVEVFGGTEAMRSMMQPWRRRGSKDAREPNAYPESNASPGYWAAALQRLDALEVAGLLKPSEAQELRKRCLAEDRGLQILDLCYGTPTSEKVPDGVLQPDTVKELLMQQGSTPVRGPTLYAQRLREWLADENDK